MRRQVQHLSLAFLLGTSVLVGCQKESVHPSEEVVNTTTAGVKPTTPEELKLVQNLKTAGEILKVIYRDKKVVDVVNASIASRAYTDASIRLADLLFFEGSRLSKNKTFQAFVAKANINVATFRDAFLSEASKLNNGQFNAYLDALRASNQRVLTARAANEGNYYNQSGEGGSTIYMPYHEQWLPPIDQIEGWVAPWVVSVVTAEEDSDSGTGYQPIYSSGSVIGYNPVLVNDQFAQLNPTHILGVNGIEPYDIPDNVSQAAFDPGGPITVPGLPRETKQVYIGDIQTAPGIMYDKLISFSGNGGGAEIVFTRSDGFLKVNDGQVDLATTFFTPPIHYSRRRSGNGDWVNASSEWDFDWEATNHQEYFAVFEEDNRNEQTVNGSLSTTLTIPATPGNPSGSVTGNIGFTIKFKSDDYLLAQQKYNRDVFFALNRISADNIWWKNWPVRNAGSSFRWTFNDRTLIP